MYLGVGFDADGHGQAIPPVLVSPPFSEVSQVDGLAMILSTEKEFSKGDGGRASGGGHRPVVPWTSNPR